MMTVKEISEQLGKSGSTIRRWIKQGKIDAVMVDGKYEIAESALKEYLESQSEPQSHRNNGHKKNGFVELESLLLQNEALSREISVRQEEIDSQNKEIESQKTAIEELKFELEMQREKNAESDKKAVEKSSESSPVPSEETGSYTRKYKDGEVIFEEGSTGKHTYFIVSGKVEVSQRAGKKRMIVTTLEEGDFFGEMAALTGYNRSMTITAVGEVLMRKLSPGELMEYMKLNPEFTMDICIKVSQRLAYTNLLLRHLASRAMDTEDGDDHGETLRYLWRKLKEKSVELREKKKQIKELQRKVKVQKTHSIFLRGLERSKNVDLDIADSII